VLKHHLYRAEVARTLLFVFIIIGIGYELQSVRTVQIADEWGVRPVWMSTTASSFKLLIEANSEATGT